jgi:hypothetical protein
MKKLLILVLFISYPSFSQEIYLDCKYTIGYFSSLGSIQKKIGEVDGYDDMIIEKNIYDCH